MRAEELQRQVESGQEATDALAGITGQVIEECKQEIIIQILQTPATEPETLALLKVLALGNQEIAAGRVKPIGEVVSRLKAKQARD